MLDATIPTKVVAASDASEALLATAEYVCDGIADDVQIQAAIEALPAIGGRLVLSEGNFCLAAKVTITTASLPAGHSE